MSTSTIQSIMIAIDRYHNILSEIDDKQFDKTPSVGVWSYSEAYSHIISSNFSSLLAIQRCIYGKANTEGKTSLWGNIILFLGQFPPVKIKAPEKIAALVKKINKEEARNNLFKLKAKIKEIAPQILKCSNVNKVQHPRLGMLNATQWLRFIEIHSYHHLKQLIRIRKSLNKHSNG